MQHMKKRGSRKLVPIWELWKLAREKEGKYDVETQHVFIKLLVIKTFK